MRIRRRDAMGLGLAAGALAMMRMGPAAQAQTDAVEALIAQVTGGSTPSESDLVIEVDPVVENGQTVPLGLACSGAREITLIAPENPVTLPCRFRFGPMTGGHARVATRIRLAASQELVALARLQDGSFRIARAQVQVTMGGCVG